MIVREPSAMPKAIRQTRNRRTAAPIAVALVATALKLAGGASAEPPYEEPRHLGVQPALSVNDARSRCATALTMPDELCSVGEFGRVGVVAGQEIFYARYVYHDIKPEAPDLAIPRVVIFESASSGMVRPSLISGDDPAFEYEKPVIVHAGVRTILHVPANESGTGNFNHEIVYVWRPDGWHDADVTSWLRDLARRLPKGLAVWKGVYSDYVKMKAETPLWRVDVDGNCCPSGGGAKIDLQWQGDHIAVRGVRVTKDHD
jgi:hypothetical protein